MCSTVTDLNGDGIGYGGLVAMVVMVVMGGVMIMVEMVVMVVIVVLVVLPFTIMCSTVTDLLLQCC
jgi:hypothetical protein